jgi:hypothetical protein
MSQSTKQAIATAIGLVLLAYISLLVLGSSGGVLEIGILFALLIVGLVAVWIRSRGRASGE